MSSTANLYDRVPYPSAAFRQTHPDRLAVMGTLFGMDPPTVEHCRVLEIGCGNGSNLIPMAFGLPGSEFVGVDLAAKPVESAVTQINRVGLRNIRIQQMDLMDIGAEFGEFDYIIAHGVYAWVPEPVQEKLLTICNRNLSATGVAFVSYNTNPAGNVRRILREMMLFHGRRPGDSGDPVREGKAFLESIIKAMDSRAPWLMLFHDEFERISKREDNVVYHDELSPNFLPVYFSDFVERAARQGLQFLSEAPLADIADPVGNPEALAALSQFAGGDLVTYQQYLDFVRLRRFRQTLLCHRGIRLCRDRLAERLRGLLVASPMGVSAEKGDGVVEFVNERESGRVETNNPILVASLRRLEQIWPRAERFEDLVGAVCPQILEFQQTEAVVGLAQAMLKLAASTLADLRCHRLPLAENVSERPTASLLARLEAQQGSQVTTLLHTQVNIEDEQGRRFLQLLDGTRDRQALTDAVALEHPQISRDSILRQVESNLAKVYRMGLLVA